MLRRDGLDVGVDFGCFGGFFGERCGVRGGFLVEEVEGFAFLALGFWNEGFVC